jgi:hypothetical protein
MKNKAYVSYLPTIFSRWAKLTKYVGIAVAIFVFSNAALSEDLTIHLPANASIARKTVQYQCDAQGQKIGVPSGSFRSSTSTAVETA